MNMNMNILSLSPPFSFSQSEKNPQPTELRRRVIDRDKEEEEEEEEETEAVRKMRYIQEMMMGGDEGGGGAGKYYYPSILRNLPLISALVAFTIAQSTKFVTHWYHERKWDAKQFIASGGMPSSHSATVTALAVGVGIVEGLASSTFATALILASIVMYDAFGIRLHAGKQAAVLNQIVYELPEEHPLSDSKPLRELLGHTVPQVIAGCCLGIITAVCVCLIKRSSGSTFTT